MKAINNLSIKHKMMLSISITSFFVLLLAAGLWSYNDWSSSRQVAAENLKVIAGVIGDNVSAALNFGNQDDANATLGALKAKPEIISAAAYDKQGNLFASYLNPSVPPSKQLPSNIEGLKNLPSDGTSWTSPIHSGKDFIGTVYVNSNLNDVKTRLIARANLSVGILAASVVVALIFALLAQRFLTHPILLLLETIQKVGQEKTFSYRSKKISNDEIGKLVDGFNDMLSQVEARDHMLAQHREQLEEEVKLRTSELQHAVEALTESEEKVRTIVDSAGDGIISFDSSGRIISVNQAACDMFGYDRKELMGQSFGILSYESHSNRTGVNIVEHLMARARESAVVAREFHGLGRKNRTFPAELTLTRYAVNNKEFFSAILRDITARKEAELQLVRAKEAAEAHAQAKSEFLANMSHEIRTPLNGIFGPIQIMAKTALTLDQKEYLDMMKNSSQKLLKIVNDVLEFSKIEAGKLVLERTEFSVNDNIKNTLTSIIFEAEQKQVKLETEIDPNVPRKLIGDPYRLGQVLLNLLHNAIKFTPNGGEVKLRVEQAVQAGDSTMLHFSVKDTGIGIAQEKRDAIFQAFTQADTSSTRKFGGTGLGLSIATKIVRLMGGDIWVDSALGKGSTFHFTASFDKIKDPSLSTQEIEVKTKHPDDHHVGKLRALLVEDNDTNQRIACKLLELLGYSVTLANNGKEAIDILAKKTCDLVLMDCQMPVMDGFTATRVIRDREIAGNTPKIPIIAMTAHAMTGDKERCLQAGMDDYVSKPIEEELLIDALERMVEKFNLRKL